VDFSAADSQQRHREFANFRSPSRRLSIRTFYLALVRAVLSLVPSYLGLVLGDDGPVWVLLTGSLFGLLGAFGGVGSGRGLCHDDASLSLVARSDGVDCCGMAVEKFASAPGRSRSDGDKGMLSR